MLVELAIGDAYGAGFEYAPGKFVEAHNTLEGYVVHPWHRGQQAGNYTDDTQMSLAVAEALLSGEEWNAQTLADRFVGVFKRDPRKGYSRGFYDLLMSVDNGRELLDRIRADSDKSGAAMRAAPIGVLPTIDEVIKYCRIQAGITHNTPDGIHAAVAVSLAAHYFIHEIGPKCELGLFLKDYVPGDWMKPWQGKVGPKGWMSVRAALTALDGDDSLSAILRASVAFSGDVDTVGAIAMAVGSCSQEIRKDLPPVLFDSLERGPFGYDYLEQLDRSLDTLRPPGSGPPQNPVKEEPGK